MQEGTDTDTESGENKGEARARGASTSVRATVETRLSHRFQVYMVAEVLLVGLAGGAVVTLYRVALSGAEGALRVATAAVRQTPALVAVWVLAALLVCAIVSRLMLWEPNTQGSGIPQVDAEVMGSLDMPWHRVIAGKFVEGTLCCLGGLSLGREGPSVQLGAMAGKAVSRAIGRGRGEERLLVTCGAASGMSAAFNAPLTSPSRRFTASSARPCSSASWQRRSRPTSWSRRCSASSRSCSSCSQRTCRTASTPT